MAGIGTLKYITDYLEKNKERLGPFYRPLYLLSGVLTFLVLLVLMIGLPAVFLDNIIHVVFAQILILAVYFVLLLAIHQNVFDRFTFCTVLFLVISAAPVVIGVEENFSLLRAANPEFVQELRQGVSVFHIFNYGVIRGIGNTAWSIPLLFYFYTFFPKLKHKEANVVTARRRALAFALGIHLVTAALIVWLESVYHRSFTAAEGAIGSVRQHIEGSQRGFLVFSIVYLSIGLLVLLILMLRPILSDGRILAIVSVALVGIQVAYTIASYNARELDQRFPAARSSGGAVLAFRSEPGGDGDGRGQVVFARMTAFRFVGGKSLEDLRVFWECVSPESGKFTQLIARAEDFRERFHEVDLLELRASSPEELFCQTSAN